MTKPNLFTDYDSLRPSLPEVWRVVMAAVLDAIDEGAELLTDSHWSDYALGSLLPTPNSTSATPTWTPRWAAPARTGSRPTRSTTL